MIYYYIPINLNIETVLRFLFEGEKKNEIDHLGINVGIKPLCQNILKGCLIYLDKKIMSL